MPRSESRKPFAWRSRKRRRHRPPQLDAGLPAPPRPIGVLGDPALQVRAREPQSAIPDPHMWQPPRSDQLVKRAARHPEELGRLVGIQQGLSEQRGVGHWSLLCCPTRRRFAPPSWDFLTIALRVRGFFAIERVLPKARATGVPIHPDEQIPGAMPREPASLTTVSTRATRSPRSNWPTAVRWSEARTASSSWESWACLRQRARFLPNWLATIRLRSVPRTHRAAVRRGSR